MKVLILTIHSEVEYLLKAVDIGVSGYILKDSESAELKKAIFSIAEGNDYIQPSLIPALNSKMIEKHIKTKKLILFFKNVFMYFFLLSYAKFTSTIILIIKLFLFNNFLSFL